ncbi:MAG: hypothetical protein L6R39_002978 [Caloplaca ligustica]|nr:MAG: hypothetical protein L6R39_002978 [Caloplaca ligustica]
MEIAQPPLFKRRTNKSTLRKRPATSPPASSSSSSSGYSSNSENESNRKMKRQRKSTTITAASSSKPAQSTDLLKSTQYTGDRSSTLTQTNDATKTSNWFDEARFQAGKEKDSPATTRSRPPSSTAAESSGTYKGQSNYSSFIHKNPDAPTRVVGPIKAPTNIRTITVTDFAPDVCKDYKQTGFCGFGDSCKFLHAREDYKQGWELDKEWERAGPANKNRKNSTATRKQDDGPEDEDDDDAVLEGVPFACVLCKEGYKDPIVTKCGHYFCEKCALQRYRKSPSCAACGAGTGGVFNGAKGLRKLLERKRERARLRRERRREAGEEVSEEEAGEGEGET